MRNIAATKFYKPVPARLTRSERAFADEGLDTQYRYGAELDTPDFDFLVSPLTRPIMTRRVALRGNNNAPGDFEPEFFDMGPFQITYNFSRAIRRNAFPLKAALPFKGKPAGEYGASGWSFRMLYEFLCDAYNGGKPFVDTYFESVFRTRPVYAGFKSVYDAIQKDIDLEQARIYATLPRKKDGTPDKRYTAYRKFKDFKVWQNPVVKRDCEELARAIRDDIVACLQNGHVPLNGQTGKEVGERTRERREELIGLDPRRFFFASGRLIRHLNIYVEVGRLAA